MKTKHKVFINKSRQQKKKAYIGLKNNIREYSIKKGVHVLFYTHDIISEQTQWADIYFLSRKHNIIYNATIETTESAWHQKIEEVSFNKAWDLHKDDKNFYQYIDQYQKELIESKSVFIHEGFEILPDYSYGIGLNMIIKATSLTPHNINQAIEHFLLLNETDWEASEALQYEWNNSCRFSVNALEMD